MAIPKNSLHQIENIGVQQTMKNNTGRWVAAVAAGLLVVVLLGPSIPPPKARAQRVQGVNNLARPFPNKDFVISNPVVTNGDFPIMTK